MKIIAHRSGTDRFPEQTVSSAFVSLENGADLIEVDTRFSADGKIVVNHDPTAERLYGNARRIDEMTAAEFLALRRTENAEFGGHLFEDYLKAGIKDILLHVKVGGEKIRDLIAVCREYGCLYSCVFGIQYAEDLELVKSVDKNIRTLAFMKTPLSIESFSDSDYIRLWEGWCDRDNLVRVKNTGRELWIMSDCPTVGEVSEGNYGFYTECGAGGVLVNEVIPAAAYFKGNG